MNELRCLRANPKTWRDGKVLFHRVTGSIEPSEIVTGNVYVRVTKPMPRLSEVYDIDAIEQLAPSVPTT